MVSLRYNICEQVKIDPSEIKEGAAACGNCSAWCGKQFDVVGKLDLSALAARRAYLTVNSLSGTQQIYKDQDRDLQSLFCNSFHPATVTDLNPDN
jgi:hypothetical protein